VDLSEALCETLVNGKMPISVPVTRDLNIGDRKFERLTVTFYDLAGGERQRVFWRQHYTGCQGIIYLIDSSMPQYLDLALEELHKSIVASGGQCPIAVCLSKRDLVKEQDITTMRKHVTEALKRYQSDIKVFCITCRDVGLVHEMVKWLLGRSKPL